ncbi:peptidoglycan-associated lipoprotein Pal [Caenimonas koreensis]|uniref:Peptidoglycan-associated lipoprotein n=1 Tax=Caenimonas koreensis DSM 17982 TaxID=1121255 RepID=A0A844B191_9BURK|nr:peptidoglycan-associated lipoprotein Pal [Caenimonas koreensis]MRD48488.1 peptidoglycan-associated lipoprotein Pal [Caenimonas koreensis DSM 17982]
MFFKRTLLVVGIAAAMAGCSSVKLDDVPVETRSAVTPSTGSAPGTGQSTVTPVVTDDANGNRGGPVNTSRLVYFDYDSYVVKPEFQRLIEAHAAWMKANPSRRANLEGHTDERGGREYNLALGQRRSEAVRRSLTLLGVPDSQVEAVSFGKEKPAVPGSGEEAWAKNRRVEIVYR